MSQVWRPDVGISVSVTQQPLRRLVLVNEDGSLSDVRCADCKHWNTHTLGLGHHCRKIREHGFYNWLAAVGASRYGTGIHVSPYLETRAEFGCRLFEATKETP